MPSTTSGSTNFNLDVEEIISLAFEPLGGEYQTASETSRARNIFNLMLIRLQNKGIPLSKLGFEEITLAEDDNDYDLDTKIDNVLEVNYKNLTSNIETPLKGYGWKRWHKIPNKKDKGRPNIYFIDKDRVGLTLYVWQTPGKEQNGNKLVLLCSYKLEDITASYQKVDLPYEYLPFVVAWLSYELSLTREGVPAEKRMELKQKYLETMKESFEEDKERVDFIIKPKI